MGYMSNVAYVIRFKDKAQCDTFINLQLAKADKWLTEAINELTRVEDNVLGFHASCVKWYDDYDDVKAHHTLMTDTLKWFSEGDSTGDLPYDEQAGYRFIRLGEEDEDNTVEEGGNAEGLYEYIEWYRNIEVQFKIKPMGEEA
jgi:hypothetical protein